MGATPKSLKLFFSYLTNPTQGVSINNSYSRKSDLYLKNVGLTLWYIGTGLEKYLN